MCQAAPGPRCWSDSAKTGKSLTKRLMTAETALESNRSKATEAAKAGDLAAYDKLHKEQEKLVVRVNNLRAAVRHNQRDIDGTKTGVRNLEEQIALSDDSNDLKELQDRKAQAEALRMSRAHALQTLQSGRKPLLRIAS